VIRIARSTKRRRSGGIEEAKLKKEEAQDKKGAPVILIMPDRKNNALIVSAPPEQMRTITSLISDLDSEEVEGVETEVVKLEYILADDLAKIGGTHGKLHDRIALLCGLLDGDALVLFDQRGRLVQREQAGVHHTVSIGRTLTRPEERS